MNLKTKLIILKLRMPMNLKGKFQKNKINKLTIRNQSQK